MEEYHHSLGSPPPHAFAHYVSPIGREPNSAMVQKRVQERNLVKRRAVNCYDSSRSALQQIRTTLGMIFRIIVCI